MKMRIISIVFCVIAFVVSLLLMFSIYNRHAEPVVPEIPDVPPVEADRTEPVSEATVKKLSSDIASFLDTLAYENDKSYEEKMNYFADHLDDSAAFLGTEKADQEGKAYLEKIASVFRSLVGADYMNTTEFSEAAGRYLKEIELLKPRNPADPELYPDIDTEVNGSFTLAMLSVNNAKKPSDIFTVSVGGSVILGDVVGASENSFASGYEKYETNSYPLGALSAVFATDDYSIISLRNPLTEETESSDSRTAVKGKPSYAAMLSEAGINAVNLATDHINDYGSKGVADTRYALTNAGVNFAVSGEICDYETPIGKVSLITYNLNSSAVSNNPSAVNNTVKDEIASARSRGAAMVITMFSWKGNENKEISDYQVDVGRTAVDNGADMVIGTFPNYIQAVDIYKEKTIIYSTNDLICGKTDILGSDTVANPYGFVFSQDYKVENGVLVPYDITFYPVISTSDSSINNFVPKFVFDGTADDIIETFKKACVCTRHGIAKDTNPNKQEVKYIKISK